MKQRRTMLELCLITAVSLMLLLSVSHAATRVWSNEGADNDWGTAGNWGGSEPTNLDRAVIRMDGDDAAEVTQEGEICYSLDIATFTPDTVGLLKITSGDLTVNSTGVALEIGGFGSDGAVEQTGGALTVNGYTTIGSITSTSLTTGSGAYTMSGGSLDTVHFTVGCRATGTFTQSGDSVVNVAQTSYVGRGNTGSYELSGGTMNLGTSFTTPSPALWVGYGGPGGTFAQSGGTVNSNGKIVVGNSAPASYTMTGGVLNITGTNDLVLTGNSSFNLGNATSTGYIYNSDYAAGGHAAGATSLYVGDNSSSTATFKGWGEVDVRYMYMNGTVIADGYGTERLLDFSDGERVFNQVNADTSGWYAVNKGGIVLPTIRFDTVMGQPTQTWGGNLYDNAPTLTNSVSITLPTSGGLARKGGFVGAMLATDRADIPAFADDADVIGLWDFVVSLDADSESTDLTGSSIAIRYDDALAATLGLDESELSIFQYIDGSWTELAATVDTTGNIISAGTDSISMFAVGIGVLAEDTLLPGDANRDGVVSAGDYASVQANFGNTGEPGILGDANCDGVVSAGDYASVQANFGNTAAATTVPEPLTLAMLSLGGLALLRKHQ